tara:strand:+ start:83 stop:376 length:294 start_codon:yes stop_codon:yes gene_type:complete
MKRGLLNKFRDLFYNIERNLNKLPELRNTWIYPVVLLSVFIIPLISKFIFGIYLPNWFFDLWLLSVAFFCLWILVSGFGTIGLIIFIISSWTIYNHL